MKGIKIKAIVALCLLIIFSVKIHLEGKRYMVLGDGITVRAQGIKRVFAECSLSDDGTALACRDNDNPKILHIFRGSYYVSGEITLD